LDICRGAVFLLQYKQFVNFRHMKFWAVLIWIVVIIAIAVPIFLYGAFGRPWLTMNWRDTVENGTVSGILLRSQTWRGEIQTSGDVYVAWWARLQIEPGTRVVIAATDDQQAGSEPALNPDDVVVNDPTNSTDYTRSHVEIKGTIVAEGTAEEPIIFTVTDPPTEYAAWQGVVLRDGSKLKHVQIDNVQNGIVTSAPVSLDNVNIERCLWNCLYVGKESANVINSRFSLAWHQAVLVASDASPFFKNNEFARSAIGMKLVQVAKPVVLQNRFIDNAIAVYLETAGKATFENNALESPTGPAVSGGSFEGNVIYLNNWNPGNGEKIEGTDLISDKI